MPTDSQIQNRLDAGDISGAARLAARQKIAEVKTQRDAALKSAMEQFYDAYPEFGERWQYYVKLMREWLVAGGVDPAGATYHDLENAWRGIKGKRIPVESTAALPVRPIQSQPQAPPAEDPITSEAKRLIAEGRVTVDSINGMSNLQYELAARSAVFCRAVEILLPKHAPSFLTTGDLVAANGRANLENSQGKSTTTAEEIEKMEIWRREHFAKISTAATPAAGTQRGVVNLYQDMHIPKSATEADLAAAIRQDREDRAFIEKAAEKSARRKRVMAHRRGQ